MIALIGVRISCDIVARKRLFRRLASSAAWNAAFCAIELAFFARFLLRYGVLAPSTHNSQPWLFRIRGGRLSIYNDPKVEIKKADPEGRDLSGLPDRVKVLQRGVIVGEFPAAQVVGEVRPVSLALHPWWWPARLTQGRLRDARHYRYRVIEASVDGRVAVAGLLRRLGDDPDRWAALLARQMFAGTLPELVAEASARPVTGPAPADALLGWLPPFAPPGVVDELLDRCTDADLSGLADRLVRQKTVVRDAVVDRIAARTGVALAELVSPRLPWLAHLLLAQGDPAVTAAVLERLRNAAHAEESGAFSELTEQERRVLAHLAQGESNREIALAMVTTSYVFRHVDPDRPARHAVAGRFPAALRRGGGALHRRVRELARGVLLHGGAAGRGPEHPPADAGHGVTSRLNPRAVPA